MNDRRSEALLRSPLRLVVCPADRGGTPAAQVGTDLGDRGCRKLQRVQRGRRSPRPSVFRRAARCHPGRQSYPGGAERVLDDDRATRDHDQPGVDHAGEM